jgi:hypothetical protein
LSASRPDRFIPGEKASGTRWIGGWVGPRTCLGDVEKRKFLTLPTLKLRPLVRPARSQSLYRLRYSGSQYYERDITYVYIYFLPLYSFSRYLNQYTHTDYIIIQNNSFWNSNSEHSYYKAASSQLDRYPRNCEQQLY